MTWKPGIKPVLETDRLILKILAPGEVTPAYLSWWNDDSLQQGLGHKGRGWTRENAQEFVGNFNNRTGFHFGIFKKPDQKFIGFYSMFRDPANKISKSTTMIGDKSFWRKGLAEEISLKTIEFRFMEMDILKIEGKVRGKNRASLALYEKLGFQKEGVLKSHSLGPEGQRIDITLFGLLKEEWLAAQSQKENRR